MTTIGRPGTPFALGLIAVAFLLAAGAAFALFAYGNSSGPQSNTEDWPAGFDVEVGYLKVGQVVSETLSLTEDEADNLILYYVRQPSGEVWALIGIDPHSGCQVPWEREYDRTRVNGTGTGVFKALCSGSVFDLDGSPMFGPAPRGLDRAVLTVAPNGDDARLDLTRFILGTCRSGGVGPCSPAGTSVEVMQIPKASAESAHARTR